MDTQKEPTQKLLDAIQEIENGNGVKFYSVEDLMDDLLDEEFDNENN